MNTLTSKDIADRQELITNCTLADIKELEDVPLGPQRVTKEQKLGMRLDEAVTLVNLYTMEQRTRYFHFIARNNLISKFDQEDQAGER
jgi:hypothetical protein